MYYVAKINKIFQPTIVESFEDKNLALTYAKIMNDANKGKHVVLEETKE